MAKRKKAPKAAPRIDVIEDGKKVSVRSDGSEPTPKRKKVGSKGGAMDAALGRSFGVPAQRDSEGRRTLPESTNREDLIDDNESAQVSAEHNARYNRVHSRELSNPTEIPQGRKNTLLSQLTEMPTASTSGIRRADPKTLRSIPAEEAAGPATIPASGTRPGQAPSGLPDDRTGRVVTVRPGLGAPDANPAPKGRRGMRTLDDRISVRRRAKNRVTGEGRAVSTESMGGLTERRTTDSSKAKFRSADPQSTANQRRLKYADIARRSDAAATEKALKINNPTTYSNKGISGKNAGGKRLIQPKMEDVRSAVSLWHKTGGKDGLHPDEGMHLSAKYAADELTPTTDKYVGSDKAMAHELSSTHLKGVTPEHIMSYASAKGISVQSLRNEVVNNVTKQGKLTNWVMNPATGSREPFHWRASGEKRISGRDASGANITKTAKHPTEAPSGSMPHHTYLKQLIQKHVDETKLDSVSTTRGRSENVKTALWIESQAKNNPTSVRATTRTITHPGGDTSTQKVLADRKSGLILSTDDGVQGTSPKLDSPATRTVKNASKGEAPAGGGGKVLTDTINPVTGVRTSDTVIEPKPKKFTRTAKPKNTMG